MDSGFSWDKKGWAQTEVVGAWITVGDLIRAETVARSIGDPVNRALALIALMAPHHARGDDQRAKELAAEAEDEQRQAHGQDVYGELANAWAAIGDFTRARQAAEASKDPRDRAVALVSLAKVAEPSESRRLLALALLQAPDYGHFLHDVAELEPAAIAAARLR